MTHMKRMAMHKTFPLKRKGTEKFVVSSIGNAKAIPLLLIVRDILKIASTRKEAEMLLRQGEILVNGKKIADERFSVNLFDVITVPKIGKAYRVVMKNRKFALKETQDKSITRICKVIGKKLIGKGKVQINLDNGYNEISDLKAKVNDSVIFDFKAGKITRHLPLKEKASVEIVWGKYIGLKGTASKIKNKTVEIKQENRIIELPIKNILVVEDEK